MSVKKLKRFSHIEPYESNLFTCINYNGKCLSSDALTTTGDASKGIQIAAFDPGVVNTGCRIERRFPDGTVKTIQQRLITTSHPETHYFVTMQKSLYEIGKDLYECDYILVESQMRTNPEAIRMSQHIISTILCIINGSKALVFEILPTVKSKAFGIHGLKGRDLKMKAVEIARDLLTERGDVDGLDAIKSSKKKDDHSDVVLYCDAWARYLEVKNFSERF